MKFHISNSLQPKKTIALTLFAAAILMLVPKFSAQPAQEVHSLTFPVGAAISCNVNGVAYPVDSLGQMWAIGNGGQWFVTGHIVPRPDGSIAVRNDGTRFPAVCE